MNPELLDLLATPMSILLGVVYAAGRVKATIDELRRAVDRLEQAVTSIDSRTHEIEQRVARLEERTDPS
jgi:uncharacterized protein YoxC